MSVSRQAHLIDTPADGCLDGNVCVVIGGGSTEPGWAIGQSIAIAYARAGARVVVADIKQAAADVTVAQIMEQGGQALAVEVNATDEASVAALMQAAMTRFGRIDVLHNNVGIGKSGPSANTSAQEWQRFADANLLSLHLSAQSAIPEMKKSGGGVILCTSSIASLRFVGVPHLAYGVTKAAANHFCRMVAAEYAADGIRANAIVVGLVDTPRIRKTMMATYGQDEDAMIARRNAQIPLGFMGDAWDVANAAVFLASGRARFISGIELVLDGAMSATVRG